MQILYEMQFSASIISPLYGYYCNLSYCSAASQFFPSTIRPALRVRIPQDKFQYFIFKMEFKAGFKITRIHLVIFSKIDGASVLTDRFNQTASLPYSFLDMFKLLLCASSVNNSP